MLEPYRTASSIGPERSHQLKEPGSGGSNRMGQCEYSLCHPTWQLPLRHGHLSHVHMRVSHTLKHTNTNSLRAVCRQSFFSNYIYRQKNTHWWSYTVEHLLSNTRKDEERRSNRRENSSLWSGCVGHVTVGTHLKSAEGVAASSRLPSGDQDRYVTPPPPPTRCNGTQPSAATSHTCNTTRKHHANVTNSLPKNLLRI